jgi:hypothetical protein
VPRHLEFSWATREGKGTPAQAQHRPVHLPFGETNLFRIARHSIKHLPNLSKLMLRFILNCPAAPLVWANLPLLLLAQEWRSPEKKSPQRPDTPGHRDVVSKSGSRPQPLPSTLPLVVVVQKFKCTRVVVAAVVDASRDGTSDSAKTFPHIGLSPAHNLDIITGDCHHVLWRSVDSGIGWARPARRCCKLDQATGAKTLQVGGECVRT